MLININNKINKLVLKILEQYSTKIYKKRGQIFIGYKCNQQCKFCYYTKKINNLNFHSDIVYRQIDLEYKVGTKIFEIMGGEPGECKNILDYIKYIKKIDKTNIINIITNESISFNEEIIYNSDIITLSYHLSRYNNTYDKNIFPNGCTYNKAYKTAMLCKQYNKFLKINSVFGYYNYLDILNISNDIITFCPKLVNFIPVDLTDNSLKTFNKYNYFQLINVLKKSINILKYITNVYIKNIPFCHMSGYEKYIIGYIQHLFDIFDFSRSLSQNIILDLYQMTDTDILNFYNNKYDIKYHMQNNIKTNKCLKCKNIFICNGFDEQYFNETDIAPINGKNIKDPMFYIQNSLIDIFSENIDKK